MITIVPTEVKRGYFYVLDGKMSGLVFRFPTNPEKISDNKTANYATISPLLSSHPTEHFASGGKRILKFRLVLDSLSGTMRGAGLIRAAARTEDDWSNRFLSGLGDIGDIQSVKQSTQFLQALLYPRNPELYFDSPGLDSLTGPPKVQFVLGRLYCLNGIVTDASVSIEMFNKLGDPTLVYVDVTFEEQPSKQRTFEEHLVYGFSPQTAYPIG